MTEPILIEVLAGAADAATWRDTRSLLTSFEWVLDCLMVSICLRAGVSLLTADVDFRRIATVMPLQLDSAVPTG